MTTPRRSAAPLAVLLLGPSAAAQESVTGFVPSVYEHVLGRFHILVLHFPIALIVVAGLFAVLAGLRRADKPSPTSFQCLWLGAAGALVAAGTGWLHAHHDPVSARLESDLFWHRWLGVATAGVAWIAVLLYALRRRSQSQALVTGSRTALALAVILVGGAGHLGGDLAHGEGWVFAPLVDARTDDEADAGTAPTVDAEAPEPPAVSEETDEPVADVEIDVDADAPAPPVDVAAVELIDYRAQIEPIFEQSCVKCHGARKQKAQLRLDQGAEMFAAEPRWWVVKPGDADGSLLVQLMELPRDDDDAMPPEDPYPTPEEIALVRLWVEQGAPIDGVVHEWPEDEG